MKLAPEMYEQIAGTKRFSLPYTAGSRSNLALRGSVQISTIDTRVSLQRFGILGHLNLENHGTVVAL